MLDLSKNTELNLMFMMLHKDLKQIASKHKKLLKKKFNNSKLINDLIEFYESTADVTKEDVDLLLQKHGLKSDNKNVILNNFEFAMKLSEVGLNTIKDQFKKLISGVLLSDESYKSDPTKLIEVVRDYDYSFNNDDEDKIKIDRYKMSDISIQNILENFGTPIKSSIDSINKAFVIGGYIRHQLICVIAPPACLVGSTKIHTSNRGTLTIESLYTNNIKRLNVLGVDISNEVVQTSADSVVLTKYVNETYSIELNNKSVIECTEDHQFLLNSGIYKMCKELSIGDQVRSSKTKQIVTNIKKNKYENKIPVYDILNSGTSNFGIDIGDELVFVHNCGKSLFLMNEAVRFVLDGNKVCYVALGDLTRFDFVTRCASIALGAKINDVTADMEVYWNKYKNFMGDKLDNLSVVNLGAGEKTASELCRYLEKNGFVENSDVIIIDYDTNLKSEEDMYKKGEEVYNEFVNLAKKVQLVLIASQPKIQYYEEPLIPQSGAAESSRKSQIVDVMITIGKNPKSATPIGLMNLAKVRRGGRQISFPYMINQSGRFSCIDKNTYHAIEHSQGVKNDPNASIKNDISLEELENEVKKNKQISKEVKDELDLSNDTEYSVDDIANLLKS